MGEKQYTLKSARSELARLQKAKESKTQKIQQLRAELKELNARVKEMESVYDDLYHADMQRQIAEVWFKEQKLSSEQIKKYLEISRQLYDKIDLLDIATVVQAVNAALLTQKENGVDTETAARNIFADDISTETQETEQVDTYINFSGTGGVM